jgi:hypothetical protein
MRWIPEQICRVTDLPTARDYKGNHRLVVWCRACRLQRELSFKTLVDDGRGDIPIINLRFRCTNCGSCQTDAVVSGSHLRPKR